LGDLDLNLNLVGGFELFSWWVDWLLNLGEFGLVEFS
jgi:hypothetical protein